MSRWLKERKSGFTAAGVVVACAIAVYLGSLSGAFQYDDFHSIVENPSIRELKNIPQFFSDPRAFSTKVGNWDYRPLLLVSYSINYALGAESLPLWHLPNIILHALASLLVLAILRRMGMRWGALAGGLIFALHPLNCQAVAYISSRSSLLSAVFVLGAFYSYLFARERQSKVLPARGWIAGSALLFLGGLMSKIVSAGFILYALAWDVLDPSPRQGWWKDRHWLMRYGPLVAVFGLFMALRWYLLKGIFKVGLEGSIVPDFGVLEGMMQQAYAPLVYLKLFVLPLHLSVFHDTSSIHFPRDPHTILLITCYVFILAAAILCKRKPAIVFGLIWFLGGLLPALALPLNIVVAEHRVYLPLVGLCMILGSSVDAIAQYLRHNAPKLGRYYACAAIVILVLLGSATINRTQAWHSEVELWRDASKNAPLAYVPHHFLGVAYLRQQNFQSAIGPISRAIRLKPGFADAYNTLGSCYISTGQYHKALSAAKEANNLAPDNLQYLLNLGTAYMFGKEWYPASLVLQEVLTRDPDNRVAKARLQITMEELSRQRAEKPTDLNEPGE